MRSAIESRIDRELTSRLESGREYFWQRERAGLNCSPDRLEAVASQSYRKGSSSSQNQALAQVWYGAAYIRASSQFGQGAPISELDVFARRDLLMGAYIEAWTLDRFMQTEEIYFLRLAVEMLAADPEVNRLINPRVISVNLCQLLLLAVSLCAGAYLVVDNAGPETIACELSKLAPKEVREQLKGVIRDIAFVSPSIGEYLSNLVGEDKIDQPDSEESGPPTPSEG